MTFVSCSVVDLVSATESAILDCYLSYYAPYATSHAALGRDAALHGEVRNAARVLVEAVHLQRAGRLRPDTAVSLPRPK